MDIYFLRHASAGQSLSDPKADAKRPLDEAGVEQSNRMGRVLLTLDVKPDVIISSPLERAKQTAALVASAIGYQKSLLLDNSLHPGADFEQFRELLGKYSKKRAIMVVGHNPTLSEFLSLVVSDEVTDSAIELKKGAIAKVEVKRSQPLLHWILTPKTVRAAQEASASRSRPKTSRK